MYSTTDYGITYCFINVVLGPATTLTSSHSSLGCDHIGHKPCISAKTISATKDIGHKIYGEFIWRHRDDTSRFRVVRMVNLNVKDYVSHVMSC